MRETGPMAVAWQMRQRRRGKDDRLLLTKEAEQFSGKEVTALGLNPEICLIQGSLYKVQGLAP